MEKYFDIWLRNYMKDNGLTGDRHSFGFDALEEAFDAGWHECEKEHINREFAEATDKVKELAKKVYGGGE